MTATSAAAPAGWVTAPKSGHHCNTVMRLRKAGRLVDGTDYIFAPVLRPDGTPSRRAFFYDPAALAREVQRDRAERGTHSDRMRRRWAATEEYQDGADVLLSQKAALKLLGVSQHLLWLWSDRGGDGCPHLGGRVLRTKDGTYPGRQELRRWYRSELLEVNAARAARSPDVPEGVYTLEETAELLPNIPRKTLLDREKRFKRYGLVAVDVVVAYPGDQTRRVTGFTRASAEECARRFPPPIIPRGKATAVEAAGVLGMTRQCVGVWIRRGWLAAEWADEIPTDTGPVAGWLIDRKALADVKRLVDRLGHQKAGEELRRRPAAVGQRPPAPPAISPAPVSRDGPDAPYLFRYGGRVINLAGAPLRFHLLRSLWNAAAGRPFPSRETDDVLSDVYGDERAGQDVSENTFKNLRFQANRDLASEKTPLRVRARGDRVWLEESG